MKDKQLQLLKYDYDKTLAFIDKADEWFFRIRNMAVVSSAAIIAFGISERQVLIVCVVPFVVLGFWFYELIYKSFHESCIGKGYRIEELLDSELRQETTLPDDYEFGIGHAIRVVALRRLWCLVYSKNRWHLYVPYIALLLFSVFAMGYLWFSGDTFRNGNECLCGHAEKYDWGDF